jgi:hypothetical protein
MNKLILAILLIILGAIIFFSGAGIGMFYQSQKMSPLLDKAEIATKLLYSKLVPSIIVYGKVDSISGRELTLSREKDVLTVKVDENASIYAYTKNEKGEVVQNQVNLNYIKQGHNLNITLVPSSGGNFVAQIITILNANN